MRTTKRSSARKHRAQEDAQAREVPAQLSRRARGASRVRVGGVSQRTLVVPQGRGCRGALARDSPRFMTDETRAPDSGVRYSPHRRVETAGLRRLARRTRERGVIGGYRAAETALGRISPRVSSPVARRLFVGGYYGWPQKRRIVQSNAAHVLGTTVDDPAVARLARKIYASYAEFALELMRLPSRPVDEPLTLVQSAPDHGIDSLVELWKEHCGTGKGVIIVSGHIGSIELFAAAGALRGLPTYGLADDTEYPELFARLTDIRAKRGVRIIPWKNLRDVFRALREPAVLGLVVDWGYRPSDVPVTCSASGPRFLPAQPRWRPRPVPGSFRRLTAASLMAPTLLRTSIRSRSRTARRRRSGARPSRSPTRSSRWFATGPNSGSPSNPCGRAAPRKPPSSSDVRRRWMPGEPSERNHVTAAAAVHGHGVSSRMRLADRIVLALLLGGVRLLQALPETFVLRTAAAHRPPLLRGHAGSPAAGSPRTCSASASNSRAAAPAPSGPGERQPTSGSSMPSCGAPSSTGCGPTRKAPSCRRPVAAGSSIAWSWPIPRSPSERSHPGARWPWRHVRRLPFRLGGARRRLCRSPLRAWTSPGPWRRMTNPALRAYFERTREQLGVSLLPHRRRRRAADRSTCGRPGRRAGGGSRHRWRGSGGHAVRCAVAVAARTGDPRRRVGRGNLHRDHDPDRLEPLVGPTRPAQRPRIGLAAREGRLPRSADEVRILEETVGRAPEQWWSLFFPIWPDVPAPKAADG